MEKDIYFILLLLWGVSLASHLILVFLFSDKGILDITTKIRYEVRRRMKKGEKGKYCLPRRKQVILILFGLDILFFLYVLLNHNTLESSYVLLRIIVILVVCQWIIVFWIVILFYETVSTTLNFMMEEQKRDTSGKNK